jgi:hypothetical protein
MCSMRGPERRQSEDGQSECDTKCASTATPQASASDSVLPHKMTEPAATIQIAAGSSGIAPVRKTDRRQETA